MALSPLGPMKNWARSLAQHKTGPGLVGPNYFVLSPKIRNYFLKSIILLNINIQL